MNVDVARSPVLLIFKMMMLKDNYRVRHILFSGPDVFAPDSPLIAQNLDPAGDVLKWRLAHHQLRPNRTIPQFRRSQVEIVLLFHLMIRELISNCQANAAGFAAGRNQVNSRDLRLLASVVSKGGDQQIFTMGPEN